MCLSHLFKKAGSIGFVAALILIAAVPVVLAEYFNPAVPGEASAAYWMDRGGMLATYGNYPAAVKAYEKALSIDPNNSEIYFDLGVAHGEMGNYTQALTNMDKAIMLAPENGRYHYGHARILLIIGRTADAMAEFAKAADLGNLDAQAYLNR